MNRRKNGPVRGCRTEFCKHRIPQTSSAGDNSGETIAIVVTMRKFMFALFALVVLAVPFATPADAQVVVALGHRHHHRYYHHHHHYYHHY